MKLAGAAAVAFALATTAAAAATPSIQPGIGIGKVRLGMTDAQVRAALGSPPAHETQDAGFGRQRALYQYDGTSTTIVFDGRRGTLRVTAVVTAQRRHRTSDGLGVGTPEAVLVRRFGRALRCDPLKTLETSEGPFIRGDQGWRRCTVAAPRDTLTVWFTNVPSDLARHFPFVRVREWRPSARVVTVSVRTRASSASYFGL